MGRACGLSCVPMKDKKSKEIFMKVLFAMFALMGFLLSMSSCNTVDGVGEDIQDAGDAVKDATN